MGKAIFLKRKETEGLFRKGFTLIELIVVIALLAILAYLGAKFFFGNTSDEAKATKIQQIVRTVEDASAKFKMDVGAYPSKVVYLWQDNNIPNWQGPYIKPENTKNNEILLKDVGANTLLDVSCQPNSKYSIVIKDVPQSVAQIYDKKFDDGNLSTGKVTYNTSSHTLTIEVTNSNIEPIYCQ